jgi:hypothetical protein
MELISEIVRLRWLETILLADEAMKPMLRILSLSEKSSLVVSILGGCSLANSIIDLIIDSE